MRTITVSGNLGKEPELRQTQSGTQVANFNVAVRQTRADANGNYGTDWFRCSVWGNRATTISNYFHKGNHVVLTGDLEVSEYNGKTQLGVNVRDFDLPDRSSQSDSYSQNPTRAVSNGDQNHDQIDINDDDLPF